MNYDICSQCDTVEKIDDVETREEWRIVTLACGHTYSYARMAVTA